MTVSVRFCVRLATAVFATAAGPGSAFAQQPGDVELPTRSIHEEAWIGVSPSGRRAAPGPASAPLPSNGLPRAETIAGTADPRLSSAPPLEAPLDPATYRVDKGDVLAARVWG